MSLRNRLLALLAVVLLLTVATAVAVNIALGRVERNHVLVSDRLQPASVASRALLVSLVDQETGQLGFVLTGDESFLEPYRVGQRTFRASLAGLRTEFRDDPDMSAALSRVAQTASTWTRESAEPEIAARRAGRVSSGSDLATFRRGRDDFDQVRGAVAALQVTIDRSVTRAEASGETAVRALRIAINVGRLAIVVTLIGGALLMRRWVLAPVADLRARMRRVASGHLEEEVLIGGPPEVAAIGRDAESMRRRIVSELDATRGATEALSQHSPVVTALRAELAARAGSGNGTLEVSGLVQSAEGVLAGDWWEAVPRPDGTTALILADVSGHGPEAGLVAFAFKQRITALLGTGLGLSEAFAVAARPTETDDERFLSCLVVLVDPLHERLTWINAGHPHAVVMARDDRAVPRELQPTGPLISSLTSGWTTEQAPFRRGDLLVACTDGVLEARDAAGVEFAHEGLVRVLRGLREWSAAEAVAQCQHAVRQHAVDVRRDDVTCVALTLV